MPTAEGESSGHPTRRPATSTNVGRHEDHPPRRQRTGRHGVVARVPCRRARGGGPEPVVNASTVADRAVGRGDRWPMGGGARRGRRRDQPGGAQRELPVQPRQPPGDHGQPGGLDARDRPGDRAVEPPAASVAAGGDGDDLQPPLRRCQRRRDRRDRRRRTGHLAVQHRRCQGVGGGGRRELSTDHAARAAAVGDDDEPRRRRRVRRAAGPRPPRPRRPRRRRAAVRQLDPRRRLRGGRAVPDRPPGAVRPDQPGQPTPAAERTVHARAAGGVGRPVRTAGERVDAGDRHVPHADRVGAGAEEPARGAASVDRCGIRVQVRRLGRGGTRPLRPVARDEGRSPTAQRCPQGEQGER